MFFGAEGEGKSTLINHLIGMNLLPSAGNGRSVTAFPTEVSWCGSGFQIEFDLLPEAIFFHFYENVINILSKVKQDMKEKNEDCNIKLSDVLANENENELCHFYKNFVKDYTAEEVLENFVPSRFRNRFATKKSSYYNNNFQTSFQFETLSEVSKFLEQNLGRHGFMYTKARLKCNSDILKVFTFYDTPGLDGVDSFRVKDLRNIISDSEIIVLVHDTCRINSKQFVNEKLKNFVCCEEFLLKNCLRKLVVLGTKTIINPDVNQIEGDFKRKLSEMTERAKKYVLTLDINEETIRIFQRRQAEIANITLLLFCNTLSADLNTITCSVNNILTQFINLSDRLSIDLKDVRNIISPFLVPFHFEQKADCLKELDNKFSALEQSTYDKFVDDLNNCFSKTLTFCKNIQQEEQIYKHSGYPYSTIRSYSDRHGIRHNDYRSYNHLGLFQIRSSIEEVINNNFELYWNVIKKFDFFPENLENEFKETVRQVQLSKFTLQHDALINKFFENFSKVYLQVRQKGKGAAKRMVDGWLNNYVAKCEQYLNDFQVSFLNDLFADLKKYLSTISINFKQIFIELRSEEEVNIYKVLLFRINKKDNLEKQGQNAEKVEKEKLEKEKKMLFERQQERDSEKKQKRRNISASSSANKRRRSDRY
eukprot:Pgem_evm1s18712